MKEVNSFPKNPEKGDQVTRPDLGQSFKWDGEYWQPLEHNIELDMQNNAVIWHVGSYTLIVMRSPIGTLSLEFRQEGMKSKTVFPSSPFAAIQMLKEHFKHLPAPVVDFLKTPTS